LVFGESLTEELQRHLVMEVLTGKEDLRSELPILAARLDYSQLL
jgi:hypothetical protein